MDFSIKIGPSEKLGKGCAVLLLHSNLKLSSLKGFNKFTNTFLKKSPRENGFYGNTGETLYLTNSLFAPFSSILLVGMGEKNTMDRGKFVRALNTAYDALKKHNVTEITLFSNDLKNLKYDLEFLVQTISRVLTESNYKYENTLKTKPGRYLLKKINITSTLDEKIEIREAFKRGKAIGEGSNLAKELGNLPPNTCTPSFLAKKSKNLGRLKNVAVSVLSRKNMESLGMGSLLSVSNGSYEPPQFIIIKYTGGRKTQKPVVLIGKGITFDTGGISLKPSSGMDEMKYDMSGAGSVIGTMQAVARMNLPMNVIGLVPTCENMPGGAATRPSDVVRSMSGKTIEILNTDAEGRLILCDALTYAARFKPTAVIDVATLTGACVVALGNVASGLFSNNDELANQVEIAGEKAWDRVWRLPTWDDYHKQLESNFADVANIGGRAAGSITAACFLEKFANFPWAHLDIAGTAWVSGKAKGSTGRPVPLLCEFLMSKSGW